MADPINPDSSTRKHDAGAAQVMMRSAAPAIVWSMTLTSRLLRCDC